MNKTVQIKTKTKSHTLGNGEKAFMSREIMEFKFKNRLNKFISIIQEVAFDEVEIDEMTTNEQGEEVATGNKLIKRKFLGVIREIARDVPASQSDALFKAIGKDIKATDSFVQRFLEDQRTGLLMDSNNSVFGTVPKNSFVVDDFDGNYINKSFEPNYM